MCSQRLETDNFKLFDSIANRYDIFNRFSSFGLDTYWRSKITEPLKGLKQIRLLDAAAGTGDSLIALFKGNCSILSAIGIDISAKMLAEAEKKILRLGLSDKIKLLHQDVSNMPFVDSTFDVITCAFGVRNFVEQDLCIKQMFRVLKPAGKLLMLEFSLPKNRMLKIPYLIYLKYLIPVLGKIITGNFSAYSYLSKTIQAFPSDSDFCRKLRAAGFINISAIPLTFGVVMLYSAEKVCPT